VLDAASLRPVTTVKVGRSPGSNSLLYDPQSNLIYCLNRGGDDMCLIDGGSDRVIATVPVAGEPSGPVAAGDWPRVFVASWDYSELSVVRRASASFELTVSEVTDARAQASIARGTLCVAGGTQATLFDRSGTRVASLTPGPNDVSRLTTGVYFVREQGTGGGVRGQSRKVIIQR
jgi:YVTN family beta-propeller protein